jgi:copper chaperone CopZ
MSCPLCATNIDKQLLQVPGVRKVSVDLGSGKVVVDLKERPKPSRAALAKAIRDSGFTMTRIEVP